MELRTDRYTLKDLIFGSDEKKIASLKDTDPTKAKKWAGLAQRLHKKLEDIEFIRKAIPIDPKDIKIEEGERAAIRLVSTPHLDRDGEILIPTGAILDDFMESPVVLYAHDYHGLPIGSDQWIKPTDKGVLAKTEYAKHQFAEDVYQCVIGKHLRSNSVGFIPVERVTPDEKDAFAKWQGVLEKDYDISLDESKGASAIYTKWIMLEHSDVPVASNAQSLNLAYGKGELAIKSKRLIEDLEIDIDIEIDEEIEIEVEDVDTEEDATVIIKTDGFYQVVAIDDLDEIEVEEIDEIEEKIIPEDDPKSEFAEIKSILLELKEGRVLSAKNRTLIKSILDSIDDLKGNLEELYNATEPPGKEEIEVEIEDEKEITFDIDKKQLEVHKKTLGEILTKEDVETAFLNSLKKLKGKVD